LTDWAGGLAIITHGLEKSGASIDIHVTYTGTAVVGEIIEVEALANKVGRSVAFTTIRITNVSQSKLVATASHTKYIQSLQSQERKLDVSK
jgi:acyl-coenzyme A thioesterase 13